MLKGLPPMWTGSPTHACRVVEVIQVEVNRGKGVIEDPVRRVVQYWSIQGELLAEVDPCLNPIPQRVPNPT